MSIDNGDGTGQRATLPNLDKFEVQMPLVPKGVRTALSDGRSVMQLSLRVCTTARE